MKVLITGHRGQLGDALIKCAPADADVTAIDREELDLTDYATFADFVAACAPALILNAAAYSAVDRAETDQAAAQAVNGDAVGNLAALAHARGASFVDISTDFVFGDGASRPIPPDAPAHPLGVYGATKLDGERQALALGMLDRAVTIIPIRTEDYPTPARRLSYSLLDSCGTWAALGSPAPHWRSNLRKMLQELGNG